MSIIDKINNNEIKEFEIKNIIHYIIYNISIIISIIN
jgi:hypothetical protein